MSAPIRGLEARIDLDPEDLALKAQQAWGLPIRLAIARDPLAVDDLAASERKRLGDLGHAGRREEWLRGRAALKSLLRRLGNPGDTSGLAFPHARLSLTHSAGIAVAAGLPADCMPPPALSGPGFAGIISGIGVDFEAFRPVHPDTARFFLTDGERDRLDDDGARNPKDILRLWTVKEALLKADPLNRAGGRLWSYSLSGSLQSRRGNAAGPAGCGFAFRYLTLEVPQGFLSIALSIPTGVLP